MKDLYLRKGAERRLRGGHLWIYSNEVDTKRTSLGEFTSGDEVIVRDAKGGSLGSAYMEPQSLICARLYAPAVEQNMDQAFFSARFSDALGMRSEIFSQPYYRLVYGDSDFLPGMIVDRFGEYLVVQLNNAGLDRYREAIVAALVEVLSPAGILLRADSRSRREQGLEGGVEVVHGEVPEEVLIEENATRFNIPVYEGQKTGWFYDHRVSRARLKGWVKDKSVLDVYSYIGGWGVQAAVAGASEVCCIDSSSKALDWLQANSELNGVDSTVSLIQGAAVDVMGLVEQQGKRFDVIVLDPPAFIQRRKDIKKGIAAYRKINQLALRLLKPHGLLVSASCSMHLSRADLVSAMQQAATRAECSLQIIEQGGQGPDHPIHPAIPETEYLKTVFARRR
jgi:23S rRNA (cytosine1962-C5)-methyltransferase